MEQRQRKPLILNQLKQSDEWWNVNAKPPQINRLVSIYFCGIDVFIVFKYCNIFFGKGVVASFILSECDCRRIDTLNKGFEG